MQRKAASSQWVLIDRQSWPYIVYGSWGSREAAVQDCMEYLVARGAHPEDEGDMIVSNQGDEFVLSVVDEWDEFVERVMGDG